MIPYITGSEDFAYFGQTVPSFFFLVGVTPADKDAADGAEQSLAAVLHGRSRAAARRALGLLVGATVDYLQQARAGLRPDPADGARLSRPRAAATRTADETRGALCGFATRQDVEAALRIRSARAAA